MDPQLEKPRESTRSAHVAAVVSEAVVVELVEVVLVLAVTEE